MRDPDNRRAILAIVILQILILAVALVHAASVSGDARALPSAHSGNEVEPLAMQSEAAVQLEEAIAGLKSEIHQMRISLDTEVRRAKAENGATPSVPVSLELEQVRAAAAELRRATIALASGAVEQNEEVLRIFRAGAPLKKDAVEDMIRLIVSDRTAAETTLMFLMPTDLLERFGAPTRISLGSKSDMEIWNFSIDGGGEFDLYLHGGRVFKFGATQR